MNNELRNEVNRIKSGNTKVGKARNAEKLDGSTKAEIIAEAQSEVNDPNLDNVESITFANVVVLGDAVNGRHAFSGNKQYIAVDN